MDGFFRGDDDCVVAIGLVVQRIIRAHVHTSVVSAYQSKLCMDHLNNNNKRVHILVLSGLLVYHMIRHKDTTTKKLQIV